MTGPAPEGALSVVFLNAANEIVLTTDLHESADDADEFLARYLASMITEVGTASAIVTVARSAGRPAYTDRLLWSLLAPLTEDTSVPVIDMVVVGTAKSWSFRHTSAA